MPQGACPYTVRSVPPFVPQQIAHFNQWYHDTTVDAFEFRQCRGVDKGLSIKAVKPAATHSPPLPFCSPGSRLPRDAKRDLLPSQQLVKMSPAGATQIQSAVYEHQPNSSIIQTYANADEALGLPRRRIRFRVTNCRQTCLAS